MADIGRSSSASTTTQRSDLTGPPPATFRYNNPGAQYPSDEAAQFGQTGYGIIGGGHKIARFPSPVNGAAANFDLLYRKYTGMTIGDAGTKWTGGNGFGVPGYDASRTLTKAMLDDETEAVALLKAIASRESGRGNNLTEQQWHQAYAMFKAGSADKFLDGLPPDIPPPASAAGTKTGAGLLRRAREHIGEQYRNVLVPKDNANWKGPWDCAEFVSWVVFQEANVILGCTDDAAPPATADAYTGAWEREVQQKRVKTVTVDQAAATVGGIVLRFPPGPGTMGHIAICDGKGGTVEAKGQRYGVVADTVHGRQWHTGVLLNEIDYTTQGPVTPITVRPPEIVYEPGAPQMRKEIIFKIQQALAERGFDPGEINGDYGAETQAAVADFQRAVGLVIDGAVGPETAEALGISLTGEGVAPVKPIAVGDGGPDVNALLMLILTLLGSARKPVADDTSKPALDINFLQILLPLLLQATPAGKEIQIAQLLIGLLTGKPFAPPTPQPSPAPTDFGPLASLLPLLFQLLGGRQ